MKCHLVFEHYPFKYYGIGNDTHESNEEDYTPNTFGIDIIPEQRMAVRLDLGFSKDGSQFYITFGEAF